MLNQNGGSRTDTLVKLVLVFFLSLLSFSVGTFVGKQFSDSQHKQTALEDEGSTDRGVASVDPSATEQKPVAALSEEEIAKLENEFLQKDSPTEIKKDENTDDKADANVAETENLQEQGAKPINKASVDETLIQPKKEEKTEVKQVVPKADKVGAIKDERLKIAQMVARGESPHKPATEEKAERIPSSLPVNVAGSTVGKFTVQVSSYSSEEEAKARAEELVSKGLQAFYVPAEVAGRGTWYRVNIGKFSSRQEAMAEKTRVAQEVGLKEAIVQKIQR